MQKHAGAPLSATEHPDDIDPAAGMTSGEGAEHPSSGRKRGVLWWFFSAAVLVALADQASKAWAVARLDGAQAISLIGDVLSLHLIRNSGAAFSIGNSMTWVMTLIALAVTAAIIAVTPRIGSTRWSLALGLILGGSVGNLIDRFLREPGPLRGHVIDFIDYGGLFVGNIADIAIVGGAGLLLWLVFTNIGMDGTRPQHADTDSSPRPHDDSVAADE